ncbi:piggyBac transposable element-derived protein 4-like [Melitaea cinxia]|uniref:piggyBac transposable element-derived protein 4-like n=1 Tax=Melitaea cinxia TaxID=113334 RepID=UPI001E26F24A|nr:piggyBac transposable element-derived protein 4-like [Melitaea cinxia]
MAASQGLNDDLISSILNHESGDEEEGDVINQSQLAELSDDEPDGLIEDFRINKDEDAVFDTCEKAPTDSALDTEIDNSDDEMTLHELSQDLKRKGKVKVLEVPRVIYGNGKNKRHKWSGEQPIRRRIAQRNIILHVMGNKGAAKDITNPIQGWSLYFTNEVLGKIVEHTYAEIAVQQKNYKGFQEEEGEEVIGSSSSTLSFVKLVSLTELKALFGFYYLAGVFKMNDMNTKEIFDKHSGVALFRAIMSRCRFEFLTNCLRFDDKQTREERRVNDRLAPIREIFDQIIVSCEELYSPSDCCTIDEQLLSFRGRCLFKMYIPSKPDKYRIKILMICDAKTAYMLKAIVYVGQTNAPPNLSIPEYYVVELSRPIERSRRNITMDNWFTSIPLAKKLLEKDLTLVGTTRKNKSEIPQSFLELTGREQNTALFAYDGALTLLSYCPPKKSHKKVVIMLSTLHDTPDKSNEVQLSEIIHFYNKTKGGVDVFDAMAKKYSFQRKTKRWPMTLFYGLLNAVGINSWVLYKCSRANNKPNKVQTHFFEKIRLRSHW